MAYASKLAFAGSTGVHSRETIQYQTAHIVTTDDAADQSQRVINWFRSNVVEIYDAYEYANDTTGSIALADSIEASRIEGSLYEWLVLTTYTPPAQKTLRALDDLDDNGNPTSNPLNWRCRIRTGNSLYTAPANTAYYVEGFSGRIEAAHSIVTGRRMRPLNSALMPFDPPPERDEPTPWITLERNFATFDAYANEKFLTFVNDRPLRIDRYGYSNNWFSRCLRLDNISTVLERRTTGTGESEYWNVTWFFSHRPPILATDAADETDTVGGTWDLWETDRGRMAMRAVGEPDGKGATVLASELTTGVPDVRRLVDADLNPVTEDVLLNGDGQPLPIQDAGGNPLPYVPVNIRYLGYHVKDFRDLPLVGSLFELATLGDLFP